MSFGFNDCPMNETFVHRVWEVIWLFCELWYEIERKFSVVLNEEHALPKLYFLSLKHCWLPTIVSHSRRSTYTCFQEDPFLKTAHREFKALGGNFHFQNLMGRTSMRFSHEKKTQTLKSEGSQLLKRVKSGVGPSCKGGEDMNGLHKRAFHQAQSTLWHFI